MARGPVEDTDHVAVDTPAGSSVAPSTPAAPKVASTRSWVDGSTPSAHSRTDPGAPIVSCSSPLGPWQRQQSPLGANLVRLGSKCVGLASLRRRLDITALGPSLEAGRTAVGPRLSALTPVLHDTEDCRHVSPVGVFDVFPRPSGVVGQKA